MIRTVFEKRMPKSAKTGELAVKPMVKTRANESLSRHVENTELKMGFWDQLRFNRKASELTAEKLGEITVAIVEKQRAEICQKLMLELDINKKIAYEEYMEKVGFLNKELIQKSNLMERDLRSILREELTAIYDEKNEWQKRIDELHLSNEDRSSEIARMNEWIDLAKGQVEGKISTLVETHSASLKVTLELLRDAAIDGREALDLD